MAAMVWNPVFNDGWILAVRSGVMTTAHRRTEIMPELARLHSLRRVEQRNLYAAAT